MKNKSKLAKLKENKIRKPSVPREWMYVSQQKMNIREIAEIFGEDAEVWEDAGVVEIALSDGMSVDVETADLRKADEVTVSYLEEHQIQTVFLVTIVPDSYMLAEAAMKKIIEEKGGYFCGDTVDFMPEIR